MHFIEIPTLFKDILTSFIDILMNFIDIPMYFIDIPTYFIVILTYFLDIPMHFLDIPSLSKYSNPLNLIKCCKTKGLSGSFFTFVTKENIVKTARRPAATAQVHQECVRTHVLPIHRELCEHDCLQDPAV